MGRNAAKRQVLVYLPHDVYAQLRRDAAESEISMSELIERALRRHSVKARRPVDRRSFAQHAKKAMRDHMSVLRELAKR